MRHRPSKLLIFIFTILLSSSNAEMSHNLTSPRYANKLVNTTETFQIILNEDIETFIFMCIVYSLSTLSACILNLIVILVFAFVQRTRTDLSIFLVNLAVADFLMSIVCMPFSFAQALLKRWVFGEIMCPIGDKSDHNENF